jgi:hypothetical protein
MSKILHLCALNDYNGNPQRLYLLADSEGKYIAAWDEGYLGNHAVPGIWRREAYAAQRISISVATYLRILRQLPSPKWAEDVPGYAHLRDTLIA